MAATSCGGVNGFRNVQNLISHFGDNSALHRRRQDSTTTTTINNIFVGAQVRDRKPTSLERTHRRYIDRDNFAEEVRFEYIYSLKLLPSTIQFPRHPLAISLFICTRVISRLVITLWLLLAAIRRVDVAVARNVRVGRSDGGLSLY